MPEKAIFAKRSLFRNVSRCCFVVCFLLGSALGGMVAMSDNVSSATADAPQLPAPVAFSWWSRGGEPGPGYTSDKLDVTVEGGRAKGTYIRARFNRDYEPPFLSEQFTETVPEQLWRDLLNHVQQEKAFGVHLPSEDNRNLADALKDTLVWKGADSVNEKTLYGTTPNELPQSKSARNKIVQFLFDHGKKTLRSQKKK